MLWAHKGVNVCVFVTFNPPNMNKGVHHTDVSIICHNKNIMKMKYKHYGLWNKQNIIFIIIIIMYLSVKMKSVFEKYLSNTPIKYKYFLLRFFKYKYRYLRI